jgi:hypothetical protein
VATNQDIKSWFPLFNFLSSKFQVCSTLFLFASVCVCVCGGVLSVPLSSLDRYLRVCFCGSFFFLLICKYCVVRRSCVCVSAQVLVRSLAFLFCMCACVSVCVCVSLGLQWKSVNWVCKVFLFPSLCLLVPTFWKVWCFWKIYGVLAL